MYLTYQRQYITLTQYEVNLPESVSRQGLSMGTDVPLHAGVITTLLKAGLRVTRVVVTVMSTLTPASHMLIEFVHLVEG